MDTIESYAVGVLGGITVLALHKGWRMFNQKSIQRDIEYWSMERKHIQEIEKSGIEMNRSAFRAIFAILCAICLANIASLFAEVVSSGKAWSFSGGLEIFLWSVALGLSIKLFRRFWYLKDFNVAIEKIDAKIDKIHDKARAS